MLPKNAYSYPFAHVRQIQIAVGSTLVPVLLALDQTHLTNFSGNKKLWPPSGTNFLSPNVTCRRVEYYLTDAVATCAPSPMSSRRPMFYHSIFLSNLKTIWVPGRHFSHLRWPASHQPLQAPHNLAVGLPCFTIAYILLSLLYMCTRTYLLYAYLLV